MMPFDVSCLKMSFLQAENIIKKIKNKTKTLTRIALPISKADRFGLTPRKKSHILFAEKTFSSSFKKASMTVEAAIAVPLFFMVMVCVISAVLVYGKVADKVVSIRETVEKIAMVTNVTESDVWIDNGSTVKHTPYFLPEGLGEIKVYCRGRVRAWNGRSEQQIAKYENKKDKYVFVTENGSVYHTSTKCTYLDLSIHQIEYGDLIWQRSSNGAMYKPCEKCVGSGHASGTVFITDHGDRYHNSVDCSGLKRSVKVVKLSEVKGMCCCSKCAAMK